MRSKQEQAIASLRAFSKKNAVTERQIFQEQKRLFNYKRIDSILKDKLLSKAKKPSEDWSAFVSKVYRILNEPTMTRSLHSGNLLSIYHRSKCIKRFKDSTNVWRYYLSN
jgi:hypothetical protein